MNILILGANGILGHRVVLEFLNSEHDIIAAPGPRGFPDKFLDIIKDKVKLVPFSFSPGDYRDVDLIINCVGIVKSLCDSRINSSDHVLNMNGYLPRFFSYYYKNTHIFHISTDCVFSGILPYPGKYTTDCFPDASDFYGMSKLFGEVKADNVTNFRTSFIGRELVKSSFPSGLLEWFLNSSGVVQGYLNHYYTGLTNIRLAKLLRKHIDERRNLVHLASIPTTKYQLLCDINEMFDLNKIIVATDAEFTVNKCLQPTYDSVENWIDMLKEMYFDEYRWLYV